MTLLSTPDGGTSAGLTDDMIAKEQARKTKGKKPKSFFEEEFEDLEEEAVNDLIQLEDD